MSGLRACLALALAVLAAPAGGTAEPLLVGTWNLQNYLLQNRFPGGRFRPAFPMPEAQKRQIRQLLLQTRPDILFLQEMGSAAFLKELQLDLAAAGLPYPHAHFSAAPQARTGLALLSRLPPDAVVFHDPVSIGAEAVLPRGIQEVRFSSPAGRLRCFHVHLKSRFTSDPADPDSLAQRTAGLAALEAFLLSQAASSTQVPLVLLGDFNTPLDDPLLDGLRQLWQPLPAADAHGQPWTYHHRRSGSREVLDGFWVLRHQPAPLQPHALLPAAADLAAAPSDHRLVLATWPLSPN